MRARHLLLYAATIAIAVAAPSAILAYPIPPAPLWRLVHDADVIVVATVVSVDAPPPADPRAASEDDDLDISGYSIARLHVTERWKGEIAADIAVPFEPNMACPAPPRYDPGATVLAFLSRDDRHGTWQTVHLSYGTVYPSPQDLLIYAARVREAAALQSKKSLDRVDRMEWLVRCTEDRATRWDGLYELIGAPKPRAYEDGELRIPPAELLTDEQRARIATGFIRGPRLDGTVSLLVNVLGSYRDDRFDRAAIAAIDRELQADEPDVVLLHQAIPAILTRMGDEKAEARMSALGENWRAESHVGSMRKMWVEAKLAVASRAQQ